MSIHDEDVVAAESSECGILVAKICPKCNHVYPRQRLESFCIDGCLTGRLVPCDAEGRYPPD